MPNLNYYNRCVQFFLATVIKLPLCLLFLLIEYNVLFLYVSSFKVRTESETETVETKKKSPTKLIACPFPVLNFQCMQRFYSRHLTIFFLLLK